MFCLYVLKFPHSSDLPRWCEALQWGVRDGSRNTAWMIEVFLLCYNVVSFVTQNDWIIVGHRIKQIQCFDVLYFYSSLILYAITVGHKLLKIKTHFLRWDEFFFFTFPSVRLNIRCLHLQIDDFSFISIYWFFIIQNFLCDRLGLCCKFVYFEELHHKY